MVLRPLLAAPLLALGYLGVPVAVMVADDWAWSRRRRELYGSPSDDVPGFSLDGAFRDALGDLVGSYWWPVPLALLLFAANWWRTTLWPWIALVPAVPLFVASIASPGLETLFAALGVAAAWGLALPAGKVATRPVTPRVAGSAFEVAFTARGGTRLLAQSRRLVVDRLLAPNDPKTPLWRLAIPYDRITLVEAGEVVGNPTTWELPNSSVVPLSPGPALRVVGGGQQWLLPLDDAADVVEVVARRVAARARPGQQPTPDGGAWRVARAAWECGSPQPRPGVWPATRQRAKAPHVRHLRIVGAALMLGMAALSIAELVADGGTGYLVGGLLFGVLGAIAAVTWRRFERALRIAEENPRPPDAPGWGETRPGAAPVAGWRPVARAQVA